MLLIFFKSHSRSIVYPLILFPSIQRYSPWLKTDMEEREVGRTDSFGLIRKHREGLNLSNPNCTSVTLAGVVNTSIRQIVTPSRAL